MRALLLSASEERSAKREDFKLASSDEGFPLELTDVGKWISPSFVVPVEIAAVPGVGEGLVICEPEAWFPRSGIVTFDLQVLLIRVSDDDREFVEVSLLNDEWDVDVRDPEILVSDVEYESVEAPLLRDELDNVDCDPELLADDDDDDDDDWTCASDEIVSDNIRTFRGGS